MAPASVTLRRFLPAVLALWIASVVAPVLHSGATFEGEGGAACDTCASAGLSVSASCSPDTPCNEPHHHHHPVPHHDVHHCSVCSWVLDPHLVSPDPLPAPELLLSRLLVVVDPVLAPELRLHATSARGPPARA